MKTFALVTTLIIITFLFLFSYITFKGGWYLRFSDGAKYGDVARNITLGKGYGTSFSFFDSQIYKTILKPLFPASAIPVGTPYSITASFKLFGINDRAVIFTSSFYYLLLVLAVFLLGRKLFGNSVGLLAGILVAANVNFLDYATSGASEVLFSFLAVISAYFIFLKNKWGDLSFFISLIALYFARPQGVIFIVSLIFAYLLTRHPVRKALLIFCLMIVGLVILDRFLLYPLSFKYPVYPIVTRGVQALFQYSPVESVSNALRGEVANVVSKREVVIKTFYNLYNFYKLTPEIISPYIWTLFILSLFVWSKNLEKNIFKTFVVLVWVGTFLLAALTIPFYRYLHPVVPFIYLIATEFLVSTFEKIFRDKRIVFLTSFLLIAVFGIGQTLGVIFLDTRFEMALYNFSKPPVYYILGSLLKSDTSQDSVIVTNLDTWGSWYGERRTVWFPLTPKLMIDPTTGRIPFDAIYLTSYLIDDQNYYMGEDWRLIFDNPENSQKWTCKGCMEIANEFKLKRIYTISSKDNYQNINASAILLVRK